MNELCNRGLSESYIDKLSEYLGRYLEWVGTTLVPLGTDITAESAKLYLSRSAHLKPNSRARYATYL
ncbi:uncharacterized protein METZ01_LOCUS188369, partial [marine metagenome]